MTQRKPEGLTPAEELVAQGSLVMRFENEQMTAIAVARPRDELGVKNRALEILAADADAAASAYYSIPYKEHTRAQGCTGQADDPCPVKEDVEGIGIEGARELARLWGNNASRVYFTDEDDGWVRMSAVFLDLETNVRTELPYAVAKTGTYHGGAAYTLNPQRLRMAVQAGVSKAARNAIVHGLPRWLSRAYFEKAKELAGETPAIDIPKLVESFATYSISREQLEGFYGGRLEDLDADKRRNLRGLFVAIRENLVDPEQYFPRAGGGGATETAGESGASIGTGVTPPPSASGATAEIRGGTHKGGPAAPAPQTRGRSTEEWQREAEDAHAAAVGTAEPEPEGRAAEDWERDAAAADAAVAEPAEPSQPTPDRVESPTPNDDTEPVQVDFEGLKI